MLKILVYQNDHNMLQICDKHCTADTFCHPVPLVISFWESDQKWVLFRQKKKFMSVHKLFKCSLC